MTAPSVLLVGTGLIGGSVGLGLKAAWPAAHIIAFDRDPDAAQAAVQQGAADRVGEAADAAIADLVVVSVPVSAYEEALSALIPYLRRGTLVTDTGSTKASTVAAAERLLPPEVPFVGGHPMAGSEEHGVAAARGDLFQGAWWVLTPGEATSPDAYRRAISMVSALGARTISLDPQAHDSLMATVSHLPQILASALMRVAAAESPDRAAILALAAGGFRDMTRIASSRPEIWVDICRENAEAVTTKLRAFAEELGSIADLVGRGDPGELHAFFAEARQARAGIPMKATRGALLEIQMEIPDRPGVLAEVTTTIGNLGINIEDVAMTHAADGGRGTISVWISEDVDLEGLLATLRSRDLVIASRPYISEAINPSVSEGTD